MPAYNEEKFLEMAVRETMKEISGLDYEIVVINDGSTDRTGEIARELARRYRRVKVVDYYNNHGKGFALKKGFEESSGDIVVFYDADLDIPPSQIPRFINVLLSGYDVVIGSKYVPGARVKYSERRRFLSVVYRNMVKFLVGLNVSDSQVGLKVFRREVLEDVFPRVLVKKYAFDVELLTVVSMLGYRIKEMPVRIEHKEFDSNINLESVFNMFVDTIAIFYRKNILHYYNGGRR
ncbi:glycosyl transferase, family 2 [Thermococcus chitonophagus]|nr:glycosyl transferase, family 2 [Thermococcus chitonophagus]